MDQKCAGEKTLVESISTCLQACLFRASSKIKTGLRVNFLHRRWPCLLCIAFTWFGCMGLMCGCIPLRFTTSPGATGRIVDASSESPISGAQVAISHSTYPPESAEKAFINKRSPTVVSRDDGRFSVPLERRVDLYCIPVDAFRRFGLLVIKSQGYATTCIPFWSHSVADLGEIRLEPASPLGPPWPPGFRNK